jgi:hypothetical protein
MKQLRPVADIFGVDYANIFNPSCEVSVELGLPVAAFIRRPECVARNADLPHTSLSSAFQYCVRNTRCSQMYRVVPQCISKPWSERCHLEGVEKQGQMALYMCVPTCLFEDLSKVTTRPIDSS